MKINSNQADFDLQQNLIKELHWEPVLNGQDIDVSAKDGIVTLRGSVDAYAKKLTAEKAAKRVANVRAVIVEIEVELPDRHTRNDKDIVKAVLDALKWHTQIPEEDIEVTVENGNVLLEGETEWKFQQEAAQYVVSHLNGVRSVTNNIKIKPGIKFQEVKAQIKEAFQRNAILDAAGIDVKVAGTKIILSGSVNSWTEWEDAEKAAWATPGVTDVVNNIVVHTPAYITDLK